MDDPAPSAPLPQSLDRGALERVLARAAELQAATAESSEVLTEAQLMELGQEVGLSPEHMRQALAEERTRVALPPDEGGFAGLFGPTHVSSTRVVRGTAEQVLASLDEWMQREELLQVRRRFADRMTWEARRDLLGNIRRGFNIGGRGYALTHAHEIAATVAALDGGKCLVRLDADLRQPRSNRVKGSVASATIGLAAGGLVAATFALLVPPSAPAIAAMLVGAGAPLAAGVGGAVGIARSHRRHATRVQLALDQVLDRLEHGEIRRAPTLMDVISSVRLPR